MQRWRRISGQKRHSQIHREGTSAVNRLLVIRYLENGLAHSRFVFVVSKRIGNAVVRNRVKRRLREAVRSRPLVGGWDAVFIARRGIERASFREVNRAAWNLLRRSRIADVALQQAQGEGGQGPGEGAQATSERRRADRVPDSTANPDKGGEASE